MFWIIFLLHFINAKEIKLNFIDWNYDTKIEIDSLNIKHLDYGIDTTFINPSLIDFNKLINQKSVIPKNYGIFYANSILEVNSEEIISEIRVIDILGKEIFKKNPYSNNFIEKVNLDNNLFFIVLTIGNKTYSQKIYNVESNNFIGSSVLLNNKDKWQLTTYKDKYKDSIYIFPENIILSDSLDLELKRVRYKVSISTSPIKIKRHYYSFSMNPANGERESKDETTFYDRGFSITMVMYENKFNEYYVSSACPNEYIFDIIYGDRNVNIRNKGYSAKFVNITHNKIISSMTFETINNTTSFTDCEYRFFKYTFPEPLDFENLSYIEFNNEVEGSLEYIFDLRDQAGTYSYTEIKESISSKNGSTTKITIEKLD